MDYAIKLQNDMPKRFTHITPSVMKWAREKAQLSPEGASKRIKRSVEEIIGWETGAIQPTIVQLRNVSKVYKRSLAVFYLPEPPNDFQTLRDFRITRYGEINRYSPEFAYLLRETQERQVILSEIMEDNEEDQIDFIGTANINTPIPVLAKKIRTTLGLKNEIIHFDTRSSALKFWCERVENLGVFVFETGNMKGGKIEPDEVRGFVISDKYAPFIFINAQDTKAGKIFTLFHELVHLWINQSGISNIGFRNYQISKFDQLEIYCNKVAAEILVPENLFLEALAVVKTISNNENKIRNLSNRFKISVLVITRRFYDFNLINYEEYSELTEFFITEWKEFKKTQKEEKDNDGGPSPHLMKVINNGRGYTRKVLSFFQSGEFSLSQTLRLLNTKANHLNKVAGYANFPLRGSIR